MEKSILIIDDEFSYLLAARKVLELKGITVDIAETLEEAIALLNEKDYFTIIVDLRLSGVEVTEGIEILKFVKLKNSNARTIVCTGYGIESIKEKVCLLGADICLEKPVPMEMLNKIIVDFEEAEEETNGKRVRT